MWCGGTLESSPHLCRSLLDGSTTGSTTGQPRAAVSPAPLPAGAALGAQPRQPEGPTPEPRKFAPGEQLQQLLPAQRAHLQRLLFEAAHAGDGGAVAR